MIGYIPKLKLGCRSRHAMPIESVVGVYTSVPVCFACVSQRRGPLGPKTFEIEGIGRVAAKLQHESDLQAKSRVSIPRVRTQGDFRLVTIDCD